MSAALALVLLAAPLSACNDRAVTTVERAAFVHTEIVQPHDGHGGLTLTGEVQADFDAATAAVAAAEAQLRVAQATFDRQSNLLSSGFTTRVAYDQAQEQLRTAQSTLESAKAELGRTREALGDTELHARAAGVITARSLEVGQVVQAAQSVFTLAQDGERYAVFDVPESMFLGDMEGGSISLALVSGHDITAVGYVREISPAVDPKNSTVRVKVAIQNPPPAMTLGSAIAGTAP